MREGQCVNNLFGDSFISSHSEVPSQEGIVTVAAEEEYGGKDS